MKPRTADDILDLLDAPVAATAVGAALELGLFWLLEEQPLDENGVARALGIPPQRCHYWLQLLARSGLVEHRDNGYRPSATARAAILQTFHRDSWALQAEEARARLPGLCDLPVHLRQPGSAWQAMGLEHTDYVSRMAGNQDQARRFTRMLAELHRPLAEALSLHLDLSDCEQLLDLGGGSGVVSLALLRRNPGLCATVVDIATVCAAGREIAAEHGLADRITFRAADFLRDELPAGFDVVLECDVDVYSEDLFRKVLAALRPGGRFVIVDYLAPAEGVAPPSRLHWAFEGSLRDPRFAFPTAAQVQGMLRSAGFGELLQRSLSPAGEPRASFMDEVVMIEARRG